MPKFLILNGSGTEIEGEGSCSNADDIPGCVNPEQTYLVTDATRATHYLLDGILTAYTPEQAALKASQTAAPWRYWSDETMSWVTS